MVGKTSDSAEICLRLAGICDATSRVALRSQWAAQLSAGSVHEVTTRPANGTGVSGHWNRTREEKKAPHAGKELMI